MLEMGTSKYKIQHSSFSNVQSLFLWFFFVDSKLENLNVANNVKHKAFGEK
jgi:hypothetical protein